MRGWRRHDRDTSGQAEPARASPEGNARQAFRDTSGQAEPPAHRQSADRTQAESADRYALKYTIWCVAASNWPCRFHSWPVWSKNPLR